MAFGILPFVNSPALHPGCVDWKLDSFHSCCPWSAVEVGSGSGVSSFPRISSWSSLIWRAALCCCLLFRAAMVVDEVKGRRNNQKPTDRVRANQQMIPWLGALDWLPDFAGHLLLLAEGRLFPFLLAGVPDRRQIQLRFGGHGMQALQPWRFCRAKWFVPGVGGVQSGQWLPRTRSRFLLSVWGPPWKSQGLGCNFLFILGPVVICTLMPIQ